MATKEEFDKLHSKVRRCVVRILSIEANQTVSITPGTILSLKANSCIVIAHTDIFKRGPKARCEVVFPDSNSTRVELDIDEAVVCFSVALFCITNAPFDTSSVQSVHFCEHEASEGQTVYTLGFDQDINNPSYLSEGPANFVGESQFIQSCSPDYFTKFGSPVFNAAGSYVGFCNGHQGVLACYNLKLMREFITKLVEPGQPDGDS